MVQITLPDGTKKDFESPLTGMQVARDIGEGLARAALAIKVNGTTTDLWSEIVEDANVEILTFKQDEGKQVFWHSSAHLMAMAMKAIWPDIKLTIGPAIEEGFYYDVYKKEPFKPEDLEQIEAKMKEFVKKDLPFTRETITYEKAKELFKDNTFKLELIEEHKDDSLSIYKNESDFLDLCSGPHIPSTGRIKAFKLTKMSSAYWRGDAEREELQRVYGVSFPDKKELQAHLEMLEERKKYDHRKIGKDLDLFEVDEDIGPGLVLWLPKGNRLKENLENWAKTTEEKEGYQRVTTPIITKENLFLTSEHLPHYADSMFKPMEVEGEPYYIKPMNCPFHHKVFAARTRSYKDLPLRLAEYGWCHRYEQSGALMGLMRVRGMQMNDAHIYCTKEQAVDEFVKVIKLHEYYYKILGITEYWMELALRNPENDKYHGDEEMWKEAEDLMKQAMDKSGVKYIVEEDGAAFYGPKIDFQIKSVSGRTFTASTNQIDLFMGKKFGLKYTGEDGKEHVPVIIHRAPLGTHERFIGFLLEHFKGRLPLWLNPNQVTILPIADRFADYAHTVAESLREEGIVVDVDERQESINKKVRDAQLQQYNYILVVGEKEIEDQTVTVRTREGDVQGAIKTQEFKERLASELKNKE